MTIARSLTNFDIYIKTYPPIGRTYPPVSRTYSPVGWTYPPVDRTFPPSGRIYSPSGFMQIKFARIDVNFPLKTPDNFDISIVVL